MPGLYSRGAVIVSHPSRTYIDNSTDAQRALGNSCYVGDAVVPSDASVFGTFVHRYLTMIPAIQPTD